ncbi:protein-tyrosine phosphatase-like protein [Mucor mucedo]|uniref:protein-tyrosine phosphatase-like protein n=1 Tax=Mucor mucedo TaxID=29922 RepID=UPI00221F9876|nr:protein-tyrosine phosphatase-like protein [Mucor mucedo]KAI7897306.1 protein-tyrosine phosphatase-like protein [Mucor mucedo]
MMMMKPPAYTKIQNPLLNPPSYIVYNDVRFLIIDTPCISNMSRYIKEFERWNVTDVVRCCKATYSQTLLNDHGIKVHDWIFSDGDPPSKIIIDEWLNLVDNTFKTEQDEYDQEEKDDEDPSVIKKRPCIAAHCVAGLGRAPVLVAIALIEEGMDPLDSVAFVRKHRQGAINKRQLKYLESYKRRSNQASCIIS